MNWIARTIYNNCSRRCWSCLLDSMKFKSLKRIRKLYYIEIKCCNCGIIYISSDWDMRKLIKYKGKSVKMLSDPSYFSGPQWL